VAVCGVLCGVFFTDPIFGQHLHVKWAFMALKTQRGQNSGKAECGGDTGGVTQVLLTHVKTEQ
jgi:hypothetical protein